MAEFILIGVDDPYQKTPLQPDIIGSSGNKLWAMTGMTMPHYVNRFERINLWEVGEQRDWRIGRARARGILEGANKIAGTFIICLGRDVAEAFGIHNRRKMKFIELKQNVWVAHLPHTSGLNRWYNSAENKEAATEFMRQVAAAASGEMTDDDIFHALGQL